MCSNTHRHRYIQPHIHHRKGGYYEDSDVATHFTSAMSYRQTDMGAASHSTASDPKSAPPRRVSPHSETTCLATGPKSLPQAKVYSE